MAARLDRSTNDANGCACGEQRYREDDAMRHIHCARCGVYLGEIRDARLQKGIVHYCAKCDQVTRVASSTDMPEFLRNIFK